MQRLVHCLHVTRQNKRDRGDDLPVLLKCGCKILFVILSNRKYIGITHHNLHHVLLVILFITHSARSYIFRNESIVFGIAQRAETTHNSIGNGNTSLIVASSECIHHSSSDSSC